jgi:hypothetical protein
MQQQLPPADGNSTLLTNTYLKQYLTGMGDGIALLLAFCVALSVGVDESQTVFKKGMAIAALSSAVIGVGSFFAAKSRQKDLAQKTPSEEKMQFESTLHKTVELFKQLDLGIDMQHKVTETITHDQEEWKSYLQTQQQPTLQPQPDQLYKSTIAAVLANSTGAAMALVPWALTSSTENAFTIAIYACLPLLFITGLLKSKINKEPLWWGGIRQLLLGTILAFTGYLIALIFK